MENEGRFTPPSEFCPNPDDYTSPSSEGTEYEVSEFIAGLVTIIQPEYVVETGTYHGDTTQHMARAIISNGHGVIDTIEKDDTAYKIASVRLAYLMEADIVRLIHGNTMEFTPRHNIDFAFFDSWQEGRAQEFLRYHGMGFLKKDTIVAFHDTAPHHQVWKYVWELEQWGFIKAINFHNPRGLTVAQVLK